MDVTQLMESNNITVEFVKSSPTKQMVILSGGAMQLQPDGKNKLNMLVEIDGKQKNWKPNTASMKYISDKYSKESSNWVGKQYALNIEIEPKNKREMVIAKPL